VTIYLLSTQSLFTSLICYPLICHYAHSGRDAGSGTDWEDSEDEYLRTSLGLNLALPPSSSQMGSPSKLRAVVERATHTQRRYEEKSVNRSAASHPLSHGSGSGSEMCRPNSAVVDPSPMWVESKLPSVRASKNTRDATADQKMGPLFSNERVDSKPRSKSATGGRRPAPGSGPGSGIGSGPSPSPHPSSPGSIHREGRGRQVNPSVMSYGSGVPSIYSQKQRQRPNISEEHTRASAGYGARLSSAGTSRKPFTAGSTNSPIKPRAVESKRAVPNSAAPLPARGGGGGGGALEDKLAFMFSSDVINRLDSIVPLR
jgi:hypothetical protein